jgi:alkanesulfonate monooxygenase SsuD/methylene tetrahydromethanopterin reductase-like flavin-dependent oxidoreductase (luciferase family)
MRRAAAKANNARIGVLLPTRDVVVADGDPRQLVEMAVEAEALGYDSVWAGESVVARPRYDPVTVLAAAAVTTSTVLLGTAVLLANLRSPVQLAQTAASIDRLSGGRLILGVGVGPSYGPSRKEYSAVGVGFEHRFARLAENVALCRQLWSGAPVTFSGRFYELRNVTLGPTPVAGARLPVWLGAKGALGRAFAGGAFDGWLPGPQSPDWFANGMKDLARAAAEAGRAKPPDGGVYVTATVARDGAAAREGARRAIERYYAQPYEVVAGLHDSFLGPAERVAAWLGDYVAVGAQHLVIRFLGADPIAQMRACAPYLGVARGGAGTAHLLAGPS